MAKASASKPTAPGAKQSTGGLRKGSTRQMKIVHDMKTGQLLVSRARFEAVMRAAEQSGLLSEKMAASAAG
jgi:hypothetical protein